MRRPYQVIVIPFCIKGDALFVYIFQKKAGKWWQFISGGGEDEESIAETAIRELEEETGIRNDNVLIELQTVNSIPVSAFSEKQKQNWKDNIYVISEYAFAKEIGDVQIELSEEHDEFQCVTIEQAYSMLRYDSNKTALYELSQLFESQQFWQRGYDCVAPGDHWEFNSDVSQVFHNMLRRSIPELEMMRDLVTLYGSRFVKPNTTIMDLGCSCGDSLLPFVRKFGASNHYIGIDQSEAMLKQAECNFHNEVKSGIVELLNLDLCKEFPKTNACLILSVLTMQFIPVEKRKENLQQIFSSLLPDGALILVEKIKGRDALEENTLTELYYELKNIQGYSWQSIERKRMSLHNTMIPFTIECNVGLLYESGFKRVDCFWRCLNFAAWIAIK